LLFHFDWEKRLNVPLRIKQFLSYYTLKVPIDCIMTHIELQLLEGLQCKTNRTPLTNKQYSEMTNPDQRPRNLQFATK
jgi:hypothetical protein